MFIASPAAFARRVLHVSVAFFASLLLAPAVSAQQGATTITGRVTGEEGRALQGATVVLAGSELAARTSETGMYRLERVPSGAQRLTVRLIGYQPQTITLNVGAEPLQRDIVLVVSAQALESVNIAGQLGQAEAFNRQREAPNIKNVVSSEHIERFPDPNVSAVIRRMPGVAATSDRGEPGSLYLRGLNPNFTTVTVNGERVPSTGSGRGTSLSGISAEMLQSLEVIKAITPDMDADAVAGSINLQTRRATKRQIDGRIEGGTHTLADGGTGRGALFVGDRFGNTGVIVGADYSRQQRETQNVQTRWTDYNNGSGTESVISRLTAQYYPMDRTRYSLNSTIDHQFSPTSSVFLTALASQYNTNETRHTLAYRLDVGTRVNATTVNNGRLEREGRNTLTEQRIYSLSGGGDHTVRNMMLDYRFSASEAESNQPFRNYLSYERRGVNLEGFAADRFRPEVRTLNIDAQDPGVFNLLSHERRPSFAEDRNLSGMVNLAIPFSTSAGTGSVKFGGKMFSRRKNYDSELAVFELQQRGQFTLADVRTNTGTRRIGFGGYDMGPVVDFSAGRQLVSANETAFADDINETRAESDSEDYRANEDIAAGYLMGTFNVGRLQVLAGTRYERATMSYGGKRLVFDAEGDYVETSDVAANSNNGFLFPMAHARYRINDRANLRFAYTSTIGRPGFQEIAPNEFINFEDQVVTRGNPNLLPTRAQNIDLLAEYYMSSVGVLSGGVFAKRFRDFAFRARSDIDAGSLIGFELSQPQNGDEAIVYGFETAWQQRLAFLPGALDGLGIFANYTFTRSQTDLGRQFDRDNVPFPFQMPHFGNVALSYDKFGFSGLVSVNHQAGHAMGIGRTPELDSRRDSRTQVDLAGSQRLSNGMRLFVEVNNLTNASYLQYFGSTFTPRESELEGIWGTVGLRFDF